jgi:hypothetical protein
MKRRMQSWTKYLCASEMSPFREAPSYLLPNFYASSSHGHGETENQN